MIENDASNSNEKRIPIIKINNPIITRRNEVYNEVVTESTRTILCGVTVCMYM